MSLVPTPSGKVPKRFNCRQNRHSAPLTLCHKHDPPCFGMGRDVNLPQTNASAVTSSYFAATAFFGNISPMRLICAPTSFSFSSMRS